MISPFRIAVQGLVPGGAPLEIASQGLLVTITPPEPEEENNFFVPVFFRPPPKDRKSVRIEVEGCTLRISCTSENVAAGMPTTEELDLQDDVAWVEHTRRMEAEAAEAREAAIRHQLWEHFEEIREAKEIKAEEARAFRKNVANIARDLRKGRFDVVGVSAAIVGLGQENFELRQRLEALEAEAAEAEKKASKPARTPAKK